MSDYKIQKQRNRSQAIGLILAGAVVPKTFQKSLMPRSGVDQSLITGITIALVYMMGTVFQDAVEVTTNAIIPGDDITINGGDEGIALDKPAVSSILAIMMGYFIQKKYPYHKDEKLPISAARTSGYWVQVLGLAGLIYGGIELTNNALSRDQEKADSRNLMPYVVGAGLLFSLLDEYLALEGNKTKVIKQNLLDQKPVRVAGVGVVIASALASLVYGERALAKVVDRTVAKNAPYFKRSWLPIGHLITAGALGYGLTRLIGRTYHNIENNAESMEAGFSSVPTSVLSSGSTPSAVSWQTIAVQGRRHISSKLTAQQIEEVMKESAIEPIRIFVGIDSAPSEEDRVAMALHELDRTKAWEREAIIVISPTGTGYINYVMSESVEYMSRGNVASVAIQYSKRPSPMSLDRVSEGYRQYRMLLNGIKRKLDTLPASKRPRILLFGESLGAWTSQNAFIHEGTDGLQYLGIDSALWIGTPAGSKWKDQVLSGNLLNTDRQLIGLFDSYADVRALDKKEREAMRYILLTHHNDPITQFSLDLLIKQPEWIDDPNKRPKEMKQRLRYRTPTLFVQMLFGMKNALKPIPGDFVAFGHDYRKDLAEFIRFSYRFKISSSQLTRIEKALRHNELVRQSMIDLGIAESETDTQARH